MGYRATLLACVFGVGFALHPVRASAQGLQMGATVAPGGVCPTASVVPQGVGRYVYMNAQGALCVSGGSSSSGGFPTQTGLTPGQVSIGTTPTLINAASATQGYIIITNLSPSATIYIGPAGVTTSNGYALQPGYSSFPIYSQAAVYGVVAGGTASANFASFTGTGATSTTLVSSQVSITSGAATALTTSTADKFLYIQNCGAGDLYFGPTNTVTASGAGVGTDIPGSTNLGSAGANMILPYSGPAYAISPSGTTTTACVLEAR
jgi:hypothetical protein